MTKNITKLLEQYKKTVIHRTDRTQTPFGQIQLSNAPIRFEAAEKTQAVTSNQGEHYYMDYNYNWSERSPHRMSCSLLR